MSCNRDSNCLRIANNIYPGLKSDISSSMMTVKNELSEIVSSLDGLYVPDDYLGTKVKDRLKSICNYLNDDIGNVINLKVSINSFISEKIDEHQRHYNTWKLLQQDNNSKTPVTEDNR